MKKRLEIAIYSGEIPGPTFVEHLIDGLSKQDDIRVVLFGSQNKHVKYSSSVKVYGNSKNKFTNGIITLYRSICLFIAYPKRFFKLLKALKRYNSTYSKWQWWSRYVPVMLHLPDLFHIQWAKDLSKWLFLKDTFQCKLVLSLLGSHINYSPIADYTLASSYKANFPKVDGFHAISKAMAEEALKYGVEPSKMKVIHTNLSPKLFDMFETQPVHRKPIKILSIGRYHWVKGYRYALTALKHLKDRKISVSYTIIAQGNVPEELLYLQNELGLLETVHFLSDIPQDVLFQKMKGYDILLLPSLSEGIANVVLEAMDMGIPVISTDCGGMAEVVIPKETGWLVPVRDPEAIANAVIEVSKTSEIELQRITRNAHDFVKAHFNAEESIRQFLELYEDVMNNDE